MKRLTLFVAASLLVAACQDAPEPVGPDVSPQLSAAAVDREMIVLLDPALAPDGHERNQAAARSIARDLGVQPRHAYGTAVFGFSGVVPEGRLAALERDPRVVHVEAVEAWPLAVDFAALATAQAASQVLPTGIDRAEVDRNPKVTTDGTGTAVGLDIAIIDTGIADHEDLNIGVKVSFSGGDGNDKNGHGTHVAGSAAAKDNGVGVVGVAPGARVHAVQVCKPGGMCFSGDMVAGIDWVTARKKDANEGGSNPIDFAAANFSISSADTDNTCDNPVNAIHTAVCSLVEAGVPFVMAAGNDNREKSPFPVGFAVSALADFDGKAGGAASPTCRTDTDETLANFSNHGQKVDIAAPGVCILSTWNDGGYATISGTSMASPHTAGAVALYLHANGQAPKKDRAGVDAIKNAITDAALPQGTANHECSYDDSRIGGPLLFTNAAAFGGDGSCEVAGEEPAPEPDPVTDIAVTAVSAPSSVVKGDLVSVDVTVENVGTEDVTSDIGVTLTDDTDNEVIGTQTISGGLAAGASTTLTYSWNTGSATLGDHTLTASHDFTDDDGSNDSKSTTVTVNEESAGDSPPAIDIFDPSTRVTGPWNRVDVDWAVSDPDGDLASVVSELLDSGGNVLERIESSVSGSEASGTHNHRTMASDASSVRLTVTDTVGNSTSDEKSVTF